MKLTHYLLIIGLLMLAGCSSTTMTVDSYDGQTGKSARKVYTKYYDAGTWLIPNHIGVVVVVDHEKTRLPIVSGVQQSMGALGPDDCYAMGKVTIYIWNFDSKPVPVKILRVASGSEAITLNSAIINALPQTRTGAVAGRLKIFDDGTELPIKLEYELNGRRSKSDLILLRRTQEDLVKYFGPGGTPPYPWGKGAGKKNQ